MMVNGAACGIGASWGTVVDRLLPGVAGRRRRSGVRARVVAVHATLLMIAMTTPPRVSTPTITAAATARPRRCRRASKIATAMLAKISAA